MKTFLILLLALLLLSGCQPAGTSSFGLDCSIWTNGIQRCVDKDYGYICYLHGAEGIWCGKLEQ